MKYVDTISMLYILTLPRLLGVQFNKLRALETIQLINLSPDVNARNVSHSGAFGCGVEDCKRIWIVPFPCGRRYLVIQDMQLRLVHLFTWGFGKQPLILQMVTYLVTRRIDQIDPMDIG